MKSFDEEYPSLKNYNQMIGSKIRWHKEVDIQEHCLDKAKIKEAIDSSEDCYLEIASQEQANIIVRLIRDLRKELGL